MAFPVCPFHCPSMTEVLKSCIFAFTSAIPGAMAAPLTRTAVGVADRKAVCNTALFSVVLMESPPK